MIRRPRRPAQARNPPLAPGWDKYKAAHASWYRNNRQNGQAYRNYLEHCKHLLKPDWIALDPRLQVIYQALDKRHIPPGSNHVPPQRQNRFAWPATIPCPAGHVPPPPAVPPTAAQIIAAQPAIVRNAHHQLVTATAAPPPALSLTTAQTLAALASSAQLAAVRVVGRETERARQGYRRQALPALDRARRRTVFPILKESGSDNVPEIIPSPRGGLNSTIDDDRELFGVTPDVERSTQPWVCPGSSDPASDIQWEPKRELGAGTGGRAILWLKKEKNTDKIIDRVVTKDLHFARCWAKRTQWTDDERTTPMEAAIHAAICEEESPFFIRPRGFRIRRDLQVVRIATEFTHMGDLASLLTQFCYKADARGTEFWKQQGAAEVANHSLTSAHAPQPESGRYARRGSADVEVNKMLFSSSPSAEDKDNNSQANTPKPVHHKDGGQEENVPVPEHFVWLLFRALIASTITMHNANAIHLDLHYGNVLLGEDTGLMGDYGVKPLIADFGLAMPVQSDPFDNPADFRMENKQETWAPEQMITYPRVVAPPAGEPAIGKHTSVFHLGMLIHSVVNGGASPNWDILSDPVGGVFKYRDQEVPKRHFRCTWKYRDLLFNGQALTEDRYLDEVLLHCHSDEDGSNAYYRAQLAPFLPTIKRCLAFNPSDRITLLNLRDEVDRRLVAFEGVPVDADVILSRLPKRRHSEAFDDESDNAAEDEDEDGEIGPSATDRSRPTRGMKRPRVTGE
ncbi:hypothetical protein FKW77_000595 [Venturia effusa]|uniref:Protein kinase domain-containing protein n=1 Tax=Venturia effusa TaxID=50376 RepID=A0A517LM27_9PEZI|nr:hypothetical protein FKW77_000595 [Venturia effusa]